MNSLRSETVPLALAKVMRCVRSSSIRKLRQVSPTSISVTLGVSSPDETRIRWLLWAHARSHHNTRLSLRCSTPELLDPPVGFAVTASPARGQGSGEPLNSEPMNSPEGHLTLGFDAGCFSPTPPACYRASWVRTSTSRRHELVDVPSEQHQLLPPMASAHACWQHETPASLAAQHRPNGERGAGERD